MVSIRELINIFEDRIGDNPDVSYEDMNGKVIARLQSYNSQTYTKLAQKLLKIEELEKEIKALKAEVKSETKENVADLFDADDALSTRIVETISFVFSMTKDPKETITPKYKEIMAAMEKHMTPQLIEIQEGLKKTMITTSQRSPALTVEPREVSESFGKVSSLFTRLKDMVFRWATKYDRQLDQLKRMAGLF